MRSGIEVRSGVDEENGGIQSSSGLRGMHEFGIFTSTRLRNA